MAFETSTVLALDSLVIASVSAGSPFTREMVLTGFGASSTVATSDSFTVLVPITGSSATCSTEVSRSPVCAESVFPSSVIWPAGISTPFCSRASEMSVRVTPAANIFVSSGVIATRSPTAPFRRTSRTPSMSRRSAMAEASI